MEAAIEACGSIQALATRLRKHRQVVQRWSRVPAELVVEFEMITGVPRERLRPDLHLPRTANGGCDDAAGRGKPGA